MQPSATITLDDILSEKSENFIYSAELANRAFAGKLPFVVHGAGNFGREVVTALQTAGKEVLAFCDNKPELLNSRICGIPVLSPFEASKQYGDTALLVIGICSPARASNVLRATEQLRSLGVKRVVSFPFLFDHLPGLLPRFFWERPNFYSSHAAEINQVFGLLADDESRRCFENAIRLRAHADFPSAAHVDSGKQYFPTDVYRLRRDEVFVDCGAYDGDSILAFLQECNHEFSGIHAFEPDPANAARLQTAVEKLGISARCKITQAAVAAADGTVHFSGGGLSSSAISDQGPLEVRCVALDDVLCGVSPTIMKMDIEGAEREALVGVRRTIAQQRPILAVCLYHRPTDLWDLPILMHEMIPMSCLYVRSYAADGFELVAYSVPKERAI